jgi:uncharacterized protein (DUF58 family)
MAMTDPLLPPELLRQLEQFQLLASRRTRSSLKGERHSRARGQSVEFADYRDYVAGDDFRYLDWNLYGRLDRLYLRLYEEERELPVTVFLDASESMTFGNPPKFDCARQIAAAIAYVALCGFDRVAIHCFPDQAVPAAVRSALRSVRGKQSATPLLRDLGRLTAGGTAAFSETLRHRALQTRHAGLAIVLSDFLDPTGYEPGLTALLGRGFQVSAVQILAPEELEPSAYGDLRLVDSETGAIQEVSFGKYRLKAYQQSVEKFCARLRNFCQVRGIHFFRTSSDTALEQLLLRQLRQAEIWG